MIYQVYKQKPIGANVPQLNQPWELVCETESDKEPRDLCWGQVVKQVTGVSMSHWAVEGVWWKIIPKE